MPQVQVVPSRFEGRTAIVTGAGSGIGLATAVRLGAEGARVIASDISSERLHALANVAGIMDSFLAPGEVDDATWDRVFAVNVTALMRLTRAVLPSMIEAQHGTIVNVSSEAGLRGSVAGAAYTASKHAVLGPTKSTAFFYKHLGIRANAVLPGAVATNIEAPMPSELAQTLVSPLLQHIPSVATFEHLAAAITWLLSDDSANVTGALVPSDGGWSTI